MNLWKPWYIYRPGQLVRRLVRALQGNSPGMRTLLLPWGLPLRIDPDQLIGKSIWRTGVFELLVSEALFRLVEPGDTVVDVGANIGYMSSILGLAAGSQGRLHAFEPHPAVYEQLSENVRIFTQQPFASVDLHSAALGEQDGEADLFLPESFGGNDGAASMSAQQASRPAMRVPVHRLDGILVGQRIGLLKIDVEGFEEQVLRGAEAALRAKAIRDIVYEDHIGPDSGPAKLLRENGYRLYRLEGVMNGLRLRPAEEPPAAPLRESPSYLATVDPARAKARCQARSWRALRAG